MISLAEGFCAGSLSQNTTEHFTANSLQCVEGIRAAAVLNARLSIFAGLCWTGAWGHRSQGAAAGRMACGRLSRPRRHGGALYAGRHALLLTCNSSKGPSFIDTWVDTGFDDAQPLFGPQEVINTVANLVYVESATASSGTSPGVPSMAGFEQRQLHRACRLRRWMTCAATSWCSPRPASAPWTAKTTSTTSWYAAGRIKHARVIVTVFYLFQS